MADKTFDGLSSQSAIAAVKGTTVAPGGFGVWGVCDTGHAVHGDSISSQGVVGTSDTFNGVHGKSAKGNGVQGESTDPNAEGHGVLGETHNSKGAGVFGINHAAGGIGIWGVCDTGHGMHGDSISSQGVVGTSKTFNGVHGISEEGNGVQGTSTNGHGVIGESQNSSTAGIIGINHAGGAGVIGQSSKNAIVGQTSSDTDSGVFAINDGNGFGVFGISKGGAGVEGHSTTGNGIVGFSEHGLAGFFLGDVVVTGDIRLTNASDFAEDFDVSDDSEPGEVMVLTNTSQLQTSTKEYDRKVVGVISGAGIYKPGIILDKQNNNANRKPLAMMGKVYCKVDADNSPIEIGDMLTTSNIPGYAMKAIDPLKAFGAVIGKALASLNEGKGLIPILVVLQ